MVSNFNDQMKEEQSVKFKTTGINCNLLLSLMSLLKKIIIKDKEKKTF